LRIEPIQDNNEEEVMFHNKNKLTENTPLLSNAKNNPTIDYSNLALNKIIASNNWELHVHILSFLNPHDLVQASLVNQAWHRLVEGMLEQKFGRPMGEIVAPYRAYRNQYDEIGHDYDEKQEEYEKFGKSTYAKVISGLMMEDKCNPQTVALYSGVVISSTGCIGGGTAAGYTIASSMGYALGGTLMGMALGTAGNFCLLASAAGCMFIPAKLFNHKANNLLTERDSAPKRPEAPKPGSNAI
jgi:hypothetical protein